MYMMFEVSLRQTGNDKCLPVWFVADHVISLKGSSIQKPRPQTGTALDLQPLLKANMTELCWGDHVKQLPPCKTDSNY